MSNLRLVTGGLAIIVLALAGGTGYLIYERIQNEISTPEKVTKEEFRELASQQVKTEKDVLDLKDQVRLHTVELETHRKELATARAERDIIRKNMDTLRQDMEAGDAEARKILDNQQKKLDQVEAQMKDKEQRIQNIEAQLSEVADKVSKVEAEQARMKKDIEAATSDRAAMKDESSKLREENAALKVRQDKLEAEIAEINRLLGRDKTPEN